MDPLYIQGNAKQIPLADKTVQCVITSPPYWGLRKYAGGQDSIWGGVEGCGHEWAESQLAIDNNNGNGASTAAKMRFNKGNRYSKYVSGTCLLCGAWRGAYGLEPTISLYVEHTVEILREVRRVLRPDGVCFWNVGDSYCSTAPGTMGDVLHKRGILSGITDECADARRKFRPKTPAGLKPKDLCLIPARVALAAQADDWWVRSDIIWWKPNPMPESCKDRPTDAYEHILMLTKSAQYYWNAEAVKESVSGNTHSRGYGVGGPKQRIRESEGTHIGWADGCRDVLSSRNLRNVWSFTMQPYKGSHFATFPEELPRRCIRAATKLGDTVLDPFGGSGTTAKVATMLGRRGISIDLAYQNLAKKRIKDWCFLFGD